MCKPFIKKYNQLLDHLSYPHYGLYAISTRGIRLCQAMI